MSEQQSTASAAYDERQIGHRLFAFRVDQGLSQQQLADAINISVSDLQDVEGGICKIALEMLSGIATEFPRVSLRWLLTGRGDLISTRDDLPSLGRGVSITITSSTVSILCQQPSGAPLTVEQITATLRGRETAT
jgi:transcriptional regulator with XRE-family HTH domain